MLLTAENYHSKEANKQYLSASQYKDFCGSDGLLGCEAKALAKITGDWKDKPTPAMVMSSYVDAHFAGTLNIFTAKNKVLTKKGNLKSKFKLAEKIIDRIEYDDYFMKYLSGEKQAIMTGEWLGCKWKIAIDSLVKKIAIVDLKVMKSLRKAHWVKDRGYVSFVTYYGYDVQAAIYQQIVEINTGDLLPFYIAGASKEEYPDIDIIWVDDPTIKAARIEIEDNIKRILKIKNREIEPDRCGVCDFCRATKELTEPIHYSDLIRGI